MVFAEAALKYFNKIKINSELNEVKFLFNDGIIEPNSDKTLSELRIRSHDLIDVIGVKKSVCGAGGSIQNILENKNTPNNLLSKKNEINSS